MTDRELLELAAKAAGIVIESWGQPDYYSDRDGEVAFCRFGGYRQEWNPLNDDGDALRLAVVLRIKFRYNEVLGQALAWRGGALELDDNRANIEDFSRDEFACSRCAIVRAAAEVGKAMP